MIRRTLLLLMLFALFSGSAAARSGIGLQAFVKKAQFPPVSVCPSYSASQNTAGDPYRIDADEIVEDRIYVVYSLRGDVRHCETPGGALLDWETQAECENPPSGPAGIWVEGPGIPDAIKNNVGIFVFNLAPNQVLLFGTGYGDYLGGIPPPHNTALRSAAFDANRVHEIIRACFGYLPGQTSLSVLVPHEHYDHLNGTFLDSILAKGYSLDAVSPILVHANGYAAIVPNLPGIPSDPGIDESIDYDDQVVSIGTLNGNDFCQPFHTISSAYLGPLDVYRNRQHQPGVLNLYVQNSWNGKNLLFLGSGADMGRCKNMTPGGGTQTNPAANEVVIEPHGNVLLQ